MGVAGLEPWIPNEQNTKVSEARPFLNAPVGDCPRRLSDTKKREISRDECGTDGEWPEPLIEAPNIPSQGAETEACLSVVQPLTDTITTMSGKQNTTAIAVQKERLVAALRPRLVALPSLPSATLLSQLQPLRLPETPDWTHGFARIDCSGRVRDAFLFGHLGWLPGERLVVVCDGQKLVARRDKFGESVLDARGRLSLGESARRALHLDDGDGVLLSADLIENYLVVSPARRCDEVLKV